MSYKLSQHYQFELNTGTFFSPHVGVACNPIVISVVPVLQVNP